MKEYGQEFSEAQVHVEAAIGEGVLFGHYVTIPKGVEIGAHAIIGSDVVIADGVKIPANTVIRKVGMCVGIELRPEIVPKEWQVYPLPPKE
jgi:UDP-3-O-[3-hydroxymyristoyl] glucosamine N-acyltransferase